MKQIILTTALALGSWQACLAQCSPASTLSSSDCSSGCTFTYTGGSHISLNSGQTGCWTGSGTPGSLNFNGGTLKVCGTMTTSFSSPNQNKKIVVAPGGSLTLNSMGDLNGNWEIVNYGTLAINGSFQMQNNNNYIINEPGATLLINNQVTVNNGQSKIINKGHAEIAGLRIFSNASVGCMCLEDGSTMDLGTISQNDRENSFAMGDAGNACVHYTGVQTFNEDLTDDPDIDLCPGLMLLHVGLGSSGSMHWAMSTCTTCDGFYATLPVSIVSQSLQREHDDLVVRLSYISTETVKALRLIGKTATGEMKILEEKQPNSNALQVAQHQARVPAGAATMVQWQVLATDHDKYSPWMPVPQALSQPMPELHVHPNPSMHGRISIRATSSIQHISLMDAAGRLVPCTLSLQEQHASLASTYQGMALLKATLADGHTLVQKVMLGQ